MMVSERRLILKMATAVAGLLAVPRALLAAVWPEQAFAATDAPTAMNELLGTDAFTRSDMIALTLPHIAEDGSLVPITIRTTLPDVTSISIVIEKNPRPLAATFDVAPGTQPEITTRIKIAETSDVAAIVRTGSGVFGTSRNVKVTLGGCA